MGISNCKLTSQKQTSPPFLTPKPRPREENQKIQQINASRRSTNTLVPMLVIQFWPLAHTLKRCQPALVSAVRTGSLSINAELVLLCYMPQEVFLQLEFPIASLTGEDIGFGKVGLCNWLENLPCCFQDGFGQRLRSSWSTLLLDLLGWPLGEMSIQPFHENLFQEVVAVVGFSLGSRRKREPTIQAI